MTDAIAHRGPDGEGYFCDGPIGIGHRRLAMIDRSDAADQPMASPDGRYVLSYNGEVYNFRELRRELEALGVPFRSHGDTEVVLHALALRGATEALSPVQRHVRARALGHATSAGCCSPATGTESSRFITCSWATRFCSAPRSRRCSRTRAIASRSIARRSLEYFTFQNFFTSNGRCFAASRCCRPGR